MTPNEPADDRYGDDVPYDEIVDEDGSPMSVGPTVEELLADLTDDEEPPASDG